MLRLAITTIAGMCIIASCVKKPEGFNSNGKKADVTSQPKKEDATAETGAKPEEEEKLDVESLPLTAREITDHDFLHDLPEGEEQMQIICQRNQGKTNVVITQFCQNNVRPASLIELQNALGLNVAQDGVPFVFTGHSSSLVAKFTSAVNPRAIIFSSTGQDLNYVAMGFVRGEQFAEVIVNNGQPDTADYFLVSFKQACNDTPEGCSVGELLTPAIESNWTSFTLYQDDDLKNTIADCKHCHQPEGLGTSKILRMQELQDPWTHFFRDNRESSTLVDDYEAAHGTDETYAGVPGAMIRGGSDPADLEDFVRDNGFANQPNEFRTADIRGDVNGSAPAQPQDNSTPGTSDTWEQQYQQHVQGNVIAPPYHDVKVTEPDLLAKFTQQYQDFRNGVITADEMEDHREIFRTDMNEKAEIGFGVRADADGQTIITQACAQCHNSKLDQNITRAKFNIDIAAMGDEADIEIDKAIQRLKLGYTPQRLKEEGIVFYDEEGNTVELDKGEHLLTMPPRRFKDLTDEQIDKAIDYLKQAKSQL
jgi:hypothetical protein